MSNRPPNPTCKRSARDTNVIMSGSISPQTSVVVARAPCRVDLAGGTMDMWPLYLFHPGSVVVNIAIAS